MRLKGLFLFLPVFISGIALLLLKQQTNKADTDVAYFQNKIGLVIAENKISLAPIILPKENTPFMKEAANDLAGYIEKISGAKPKILEGMPSPVPAKAIWVGYQKGIEKYFPGIDFNYKFPEEIINAGNENHIVISGRDRWNPDAMVVPDRTGKRMVSGIQQEYGTCNAVYTFLQDQLGVRWFWPGALGEDFNISDKISIPGFYYKYYPEIRDRSGLLQLLKLTNNKSKDEEKKWARFQRLQLSSYELGHNHAFEDWWGKFGTTHPDYFALLANGKRTPVFSPSDVKICMSNPAVWDQWLKVVENDLLLDPNQMVFSAAANDGWPQGHCTCNNCRAWDGPPGTNGKPILSDREISFANKLAEKLTEKYPGKGYQVLIMGYGYSRPAPQKTKPAQNVIISNVSNFHLRSDGKEDYRTVAMQQYADWGKVTNNLAWRPNLGSPVGLSVGMPDVNPLQAAIDFAHIAKFGCKGIYFDSYWNHWSTQGIQYYTDVQLAWNPLLDVKKLLSDYYKRCYGPSAKIMEDYWNLMIETRTRVIDEQKFHNRFSTAPDYYTIEWFEKANKILEQAKETVKGAEKKYQERILFTKAGLTYAALAVSTIKNMQTWEKNPTDTKARLEVIGNWEQSKHYKYSFPQYAINWNVVFNNPKATVMRGMHPDNPSARKKAQPKPVTKESE